MTKLTTKPDSMQPATEMAVDLFDNWFDPIETEVRALTDHESLSGETVRRRLAENGLKPWGRDMWCIPKVDGEYVARMEDVLDLYA